MFAVIHFTNPNFIIQKQYRFEFNTKYILHVRKKKTLNLLKPTLNITKAFRDNHP